MKRLIPFLSAAYVIYGLLAAWYLMHLLLRVREAQTASGEPASAVQLVPLVTGAVIAGTFILLFALIAVLLARRRARRTAFVIAGISCLGIPLGTILGALTLYVLTRPDVISAFTPTA
jgi:heme/copper-type cytochrome/quinol oxidase subunit 3